MNLSDSETWLVRNALAAYREDAIACRDEDDANEWIRERWDETVTKIDALMTRLTTE